MKSVSLDCVMIGLLCLSGAASAQSREKRVTPVDTAAKQTFEKQPKVAVLAGVGHYPSRSGLGELHYPTHDVDLIEAELIKQGYKTVSLKDSEATRGSIQQALRDAAEMVDRGSGTILFFFSGHGFADKGSNYLATFEATSSDLAGSGLSVSAVEQLLKSTGAPRQVMFVDACRNAPGKAVGARTFDQFRGSAGIRELFSTKQGRISFEDDQLGSGVFTNFLVRGLRGEAAGTDGLITFRDLADFVTNGVSGYGFQKGQMQVPYEAGESSGDFLLARAGARDAKMMLGRVDVSHFIGLKPGDTTKQVEALFGYPETKPVIYQGVDRNWFLGPRDSDDAGLQGTAPIQVNFDEQGHIRSILAYRHVVPFLHQHVPDVPADSLELLLGRPEKDVLEAVGATTGPSGQAYSNVKFQTKGGEGEVELDFLNGTCRAIAIFWRKQ